MPGRHCLLATDAARLSSALVVKCTLKLLNERHPLDGPIAPDRHHSDAMTYRCRSALCVCWVSSGDGISPLFTRMLCCRDKEEAGGGEGEWRGGGRGEGESREDRGGERVAVDEETRWGGEAWMWHARTRVTFQGALKSFLWFS